MNEAISVAPVAMAALTPARFAGLEQIYDVIAAGAAVRDTERTLAFDALDLLRQARFSALRLPVAEGGGGGMLRDVMAEAIRLGAADSNVAHIFRNHFVAVEQFLIGSTHEARAPWRRTVLDGGIFSIASTELDRPVTGGALPVKTLLTADGDGFRMNGTKYYSTGCLYADLIVVRAMAPDNITTNVIVPSRRTGVELVDDWDGIGQRLTGTGTTNFHGVRVERNEVIFDRDTSRSLLSFTSTIAQLFITAVIAGVIQAVLRDAKEMLKSRGRNFYFAPAATPSDDPILQQAIGRIAADTFAAELVVLAAADRLDNVAVERRGGENFDNIAHDAAAAAAKAKVIVDELALRSTNALFDVGGASAVTRQKNLDRHWRNARTLASHNPASYKAQALGALELNGTRLPALGFF